MNLRKLLAFDLGRLIPERLRHAMRSLSALWPFRGPTRFRIRGIDTLHLDLMMVTRQLEGFIGANVDLAGGLATLADSAPSRRLKRVYRGLADGLTMGLPLSEAMSKRPRFFPHYYRDLVHAGETAGTLEHTFAELNDCLEQQKGIRISVRGWLAYVVFLLIMQTAFAHFYFTKVHPVFAEILADFGTGIPVPGNLYAITEFFNEGLVSPWLGFPPALLLLPLIGVVPMLLWRRLCGWVAAGIGRIAVYIPVLRTLVVKGNLAHAALVLEKLLAAGMPLDEALADAATLNIHPAYAVLLNNFAKRIRQGETLGHAMNQAEARLLPASFNGVIAIGEQSGLLPEAFGRIGRLYRREVLKRQRMLTHGLMPLCLSVPVCFGLWFSLSWFMTYTTLMEAMLEQL